MRHHLTIRKFHCLERTLIQKFSQHLALQLAGAKEGLPPLEGGGCSCPLSTAATPTPSSPQTRHLPAAALDLLLLLCASQSHSITSQAFEFVTPDEVGGGEPHLPTFVFLCGESFK